MLLTILINCSQIFSALKKINYHGSFSHGYISNRSICKKMLVIFFLPLNYENYPKQCFVKNCTKVHN